VVGLPSGEWVVAVEPKRGVDPADFSNLRQELVATAVSASRAMPAEVRLVSPGSLPMTASGKLQRGEVTRMWVNDRLPTA